MENERKNKDKTLSNVLIALGIIMSIGGIIAMVGGLASVWSLPEFDAHGWLFGAIVGGFNIWILGVLIGRKHSWGKKMAKNMLYYKILVAVCLLGHLATSFGSDIMLIKEPSLSLNKLFIYMLCGCLGVGISYLNNIRKEQSPD
jgi:hypothetical protein